MLFYTLDFAAFLLIIVVAFFATPYKWRWLVLLVGSYFFYGYHEPQHLLLLLFITLVNFIAGGMIRKTPVEGKKRFLMITALLLSFLPLVSFKYLGFLNELTGSILQYLGIEYQLRAPRYRLPLGLSFFTFQAVSYTIDIYKGYLKPIHHVGKFALFVAFFPQLIAGPVERSRRLLSQLTLKADLSYNRFVSGGRMFLWGLYKKVVVAAAANQLISPVFKGSSDEHALAVIIAAFIFLVQVYADFSGYTDMAIGLGRIFGVKLTQNFSNRVYFSASFADFWRGWHVTVSYWFRDYIFYPLTKKDQAPSRIFWSLMLTVFLIGLWHGPSLNWILWGLFNGVFIILDYWTRKHRKRLIARSGLGRFPLIINFGSVLLTTSLVTFSFMIAKSSSLAEVGGWMR
jgi:D-alanyl-lipoteichoic acid acyltransferase DltB (MBOAT superfamily)